MPANVPDPALLADLVSANHVLHKHGVVDGFGHVSARDPNRPDRFWLSANKAPALVAEDDLMYFDLDGHSEGDDRRPYLERFLHGEIYRARPDVMAVVHSHAAALLPFGAVDVPLRPISHMCGFLTGRTPVFEMRDVAEPSVDLLIRNGALGASLARCLGEKSVVLMRGHGLTVVGASLAEVVFRGIYVEMNARVQLQALSLSPHPTYLTDEEARAIDATNRAQVGRAWELWKREAQASW